MKTRSVLNLLFFVILSTDFCSPDTVVTNSPVLPVESTSSNGTEAAAADLSTKCSIDELKVINITDTAATVFWTKNSACSDDTSLSLSLNVPSSKDKQLWTSTHKLSRCTQVSPGDVHHCVRKLDIVLDPCTRYTVAIDDEKSISFTTKPGGISFDRYNMTMATVDFNWTSPNCKINAIHVKMNTLDSVMKFSKFKPCVNESCSVPISQSCGVYNVSYVVEYSSTNAIEEYIPELYKDHGYVRKVRVAAVGTDWIELQWNVTKCTEDTNLLQYEIFLKSSIENLTCQLNETWDNFMERHLLQTGMVSVNTSKAGCSLALSPCVNYTVSVRAMHANQSQEDATRLQTTTAPDDANSVATIIQITKTYNNFDIFWKNPQCSIIVDSWNLTVTKGPQNKTFAGIRKNKFSCNFTMFEITSCENYSVTLVPKFQDLLYDDVGQPVTRSFWTRLDHGNVKNLRFPAVGSKWILAEWDNNPECSNSTNYLVTFRNGPTLSLSVPSVFGSSVNITQDNQMITDRDFNIEPCTTYEISIQAYDSPKKHFYNVTTWPDNTVGQVQNLKMINKVHTNLGIKWEPPQCESVPVQTWRVHLNRENREFVPVMEVSNQSRSFSFAFNCTNPNCKTIQPCTEYNIGVSAVYGSEHVVDTFWLSETTDSAVTKPVNIRTTNISDHAITLQWDYEYENCLKQFHIYPSNLVVTENIAVIDNLESCTDYNVTVKAVDLEDSVAESVATVRTKDILPKTGIADVKYTRLNSTHGRLSWYLEDQRCLGHFEIEVSQVTSNGSQIKKRWQTNQTTVEIALQDNIESTGRVVMYTRNEKQRLESDWIPLYPQSLDAATAGLIAVVCILVIAIVAVLMVMFKPWKAVKNEALHASIPMTGIVRRTRPFHIKNLPRIYTLLTAIRNCEMEQEYQDLKTLSQTKKSSIAAQHPSNKPKNRYFNVFPFDETRVKLPIVDGDPYSDYINASHIAGFNNEEEYIAAQGPLPETITDFWRMIWEQRVQIIVMLTCLEERGQVKCSQYWPDLKTCSQYGSVFVETSEETTVGYDWVIRQLKVAYEGNERTISQYHFLKWPDFGCPDDPGVFLKFIHEVRTKIESLCIKDHILVHCSAGVGRTGTFIALDQLTQQVQHSPVIDIFSTVLKLRSCRTLMVQNDEQYAFVYSCMLHYVQNRLQQQDDIDDDDSECLVLLRDGQQQNGSTTFGRHENHD